MSNRQMLSEAIADAKTIKETAIANAKAALEESFTPHIKEMLSAKLEEMDKKEVEEAKKDMDEAKDKEKMDEVDAVSYKRASSPAHNYSDGPVNPVPEKVGKSTIQEDDLDEAELDEMLAELDEEMAKDKKMDEAKKDIDEAKKDIDENYDIEEADEEMDMDADADGEVDMDEEEIDLEDMSEDDLKGFIEDVIKGMVEDGEIEPGDEFTSEEGEEGEGDMEMDVDADIEITEDEDLDEGKKEDMDENVGPWKIRKKMEETDDLDEAKKDIDEAKKEDIDEAKDKDLEEAVAELDELKKELQEVNLLNAKLLYTNKLFRAKNLSEAQKVKVLESFDKAATVKETKLVFETLKEGIKSRPVINEVKGSASKATGVVTESKQPIVESNDMVNRFQKLAGIITN